MKRGHTTRWRWFALAIALAGSLPHCSCEHDRCFYDGGYCRAPVRAAHEGDPCHDENFRCDYTERTPTMCPWHAWGGCGSFNPPMDVSEDVCLCTKEGDEKHWRCKSTLVARGACQEFDAGDDVRAIDATIGDAPHDGPTSTDVLLGSLTGTPHGLAVLSGDVYVIDDEKIVRISSSPIDGGWASAPIADAGPSLGLVADGDYLYWSSVEVDAARGLVMRLRVQPQVGVPEIVTTTALPILEGLAVVDGGVRFLEVPSSLRAADGDGGSSVLLSAPIAVTNAFSEIGWSNGGTHFVIQDGITSIDEDGGVSTTSMSQPVAIAVDVSNRYVASSDDAGVNVVRLQIDGGMSTLDSLKDVRAMVLGTNALYVADPIKRAIRKIPFSGAPSNLTIASAPPHDLAVDATHVYYTVAPTMTSKAEVHRILQ